MAKSGDLYTAVEELRDLAIGAHSGLENNDDIEELVEALVAVRERADGIQVVARAVNEALKDLP